MADCSFVRTLQVTKEEQMRNRFQNPRDRKLSPGGLLVSAGFGAVFFCTALWGITVTGQDAKQKEKENLQQVLEQSASMCYALEGAYPEDLSYLKEHYGIQWDEKQFLVNFEAVGQNLPPDITVIPRGK